MQQKRNAGASLLAVRVVCNSDERIPLSVRGVRLGEASHPDPPRTRARARMEEEAAVVMLFFLEENE